MKEPEDEPWSRTDQNLPSQRMQRTLTGPKAQVGGLEIHWTPQPLVWREFPEKNVPWYFPRSSPSLSPACLSCPPWIPKRTPQPGFKSPLLTGATPCFSRRAYTSPLLFLSTFFWWGQTSVWLEADSKALWRFPLAYFGSMPRNCYLRAVSPCDASAALHRLRLSPTLRPASVLGNT